MHWRNMVLVHAVLVGFMGQLVSMDVEFKLISRAVCITSLFINLLQMYTLIVKPE